MVRALSNVRRAVIGPPGWRFFSFWLALAVTNLGTGADFERHVIADDHRHMFR